MFFFRDDHVEKVKDWTTNDCFSNKIPFTNRQRNYCKRNLGYMEFISKSIRMIKNECRVAFVRERWNCDIILKAPQFDSSIKTGTVLIFSFNLKIASNYSLKNTLIVYPN